MFGLQRNAVIGFNGRASGTILNSTYFGGHGLSKSFKKRILVKTTEIYPTDANNTNGTALAMMKTIIIMDDQGNVVIPQVPISSYEIYEKGRIIINVGLMHERDDSKIWLYADFRSTKTNEHQLLTRAKLCYWEHQSMISNDEWEIIVRSFSPTLINEPKALNVGTSLSAGDSLYTVQISTSAWSDGDQKITITPTAELFMQNAPDSASTLSAFYSRVANNWPIDTEDYLYEDANYVDGVTDYGSDITNLQKEIHAVSYTANSKFVAR